MKIVWIKNKNEASNLKIMENIGIEEYKIEKLEEIDKVIKDMIKKEYKTIILSSEIAAFSGDIIKKYPSDKNINIIITPGNMNK